MAYWIWWIIAKRHVSSVNGTHWRQSVLSWALSWGIQLPEGIEQSDIWPCSWFLYGPRPSPHQSALGGIPGGRGRHVTSHCTPCQESLRKLWLNAVLCWHTPSPIDGVKQHSFPVCWNVKGCCFTPDCCTSTYFDISWNTNWWRAYNGSGFICLPTAHETGTSTQWVYDVTRTFVAIKPMCKQCVPGALSPPPPPRLGTRLMISHAP